MLQILINGQIAIKDELKKLTEEVKQNTIRLDKQGKWIANLEDYAPTRDELNEVNSKVEKIVKHVGISL